MTVSDHDQVIRRLTRTPFDLSWAIDFMVIQAGDLTWVQRIEDHGWTPDELFEAMQTVIDSVKK